MIGHIDLSKSKQHVLPIFNEEQARKYSSTGKGWSYSSVYDFLELKNIFIALKNIPYSGIEDFSEKAVRSHLPSARTPWESRRVLEHLNALINFGIVTSDYRAVDNVFPEQHYSAQLTEQDRHLFYKIYHEYFRFMELHSWLLNPVQVDHEESVRQVSDIRLAEQSKPVFPFQSSGRFNDAFIFSLSDNSDIFRIPSNGDSNGALQRFWDVYVKWGTELKLLEKFNLRNLGYELAQSGRSLSCVYYVSHEKPNLDLWQFIRSEYSGNYIHIPKLILKIALKYRYRIADIKRLIIDQASANSSRFSLQRTSEIFIKDSEIDFVPIFKESYVSHLLLQ